MIRTNEAFRKASEQKAREAQSRLQNFKDEPAPRKPAEKSRPQPPALTSAD